MPSHDYSHRQALDLLLRKVRERVPELADSLQAAIDAGKDVSEVESSTKRKRSRTYRKTVPVTDEEALHIVTNGLRAYFVEQPLFARSVVREFAKAALAKHTDTRGRFWSDNLPPESTDGLGHEKEIQLELQTETQISRAGDQTAQLSPPSDDVLTQQRTNIERLVEVVTFDPR